MFYCDEYWSVGRLETSELRELDRHTHCESCFCFLPCFSFLRFQNYKHRKAGMGTT